MNVKPLLFLFISLLLSKSVDASPTINEFEPCKRKAVAILKFCLNSNDVECWSKSKTEYDSCRKLVVERHSNNYKKINAEKEYQEILKKNK